MNSSNPYEPPRVGANSAVARRVDGESQFSVRRGLLVYFGTAFLLGQFVAPLIAPTDVPPVRTEPVPAYLVTIQILVSYGAPALLVYLDYLSYRIKDSDGNQDSGSEPKRS